LDDALRR
jgi:transposase